MHRAARAGVPPARREPRGRGALCAASPGGSSGGGASAERVWGEVSIVTLAAPAKRLLFWREGGRAPTSGSKGSLFSFAGFVCVLFFLPPGMVWAARMGRAGAPKNRGNQRRSHSNRNSTNNDNSNRNRGTPGAAAARGQPPLLGTAAPWLPGPLGLRAAPSGAAPCPLPLRVSCSRERFSPGRLSR